MSGIERGLVCVTFAVRRRVCGSTAGHSRGQPCSPQYVVMQAERLSMPCEGRVVSQPDLLQDLQDANALTAALARG